MYWRIIILRLVSFCSLKSRIHHITTFHFFLFLNSYIQHTCYILQMNKKTFISVIFENIYWVDVLLIVHFSNLDLHFSMLFVKYENLKQIGEHNINSFCPFKVTTIIYCHYVSHYITNKLKCMALFCWEISSLEKYILTNG